MTAQEATERMAITMMEKMSGSEKAAVLRCKRDIEKVMLKHGRMAVFAVSLIAIELQAGKRPGEIEVVADDSKPADLSVKPSEG